MTALSLKFCFIGTDEIVRISKGLETNKTLVKLDLSNNALRSYMTHFLMEALRINATLTDLNLSSNQLDDKFAM